MLVLPAEPAQKHSLHSAGGLGLSAEDGRQLLVQGEQALALLQLPGLHSAQWVARGAPRD